MFLESAWFYLVVGYVLTVIVELPILVVGLGTEHSLRRKIAAGFWLTACTYPVVVLVYRPCSGPLPGVRDGSTFPSPSHSRRSANAVCSGGIDRLSQRDVVAIVVANLSSFAMGEILGGWGWW